MIRKLILLAGVSFVALVVACSKPQTNDSRIVFATILPQKDFVQHVAGERFEVHALVGPGQSPHSYTPTPDQMAKLSEAAAFFRIGVEVEEGLLPKLKRSMPKLPIVDLRKGIEMREMTEEHHHDDHHTHHHDENEADHHDHTDDHVDHHHDHAGDAAHEGHHNEHHESHAHHGKDPHIWLSPPLVKRMGVTIRDALVEIDPAGRQVYDQNLQDFHRRLDSLDAHIRSTLASVKGTELFVFHPAFGYFADEYGLIQKPVETGGKEPSARDLTALVDEAREHKPKVIFVQPQYAQKSAQALAAQIGCAVVPINPLPEDYFAEMRDMCEKIRAGLSGDE
ncbi:MAG: cation ABC transporter substrate-binding protein [Chitinivibrionales bacterium]|nr:cation ABC transporter substrate-binding protein [Chitinivibrionales bacterium]